MRTALIAASAFSVGPITEAAAKGGASARAGQTVQCPNGPKVRDISECPAQPRAEKSKKRGR